jgi:hypothetical protein
MYNNIALLIGHMLGDYFFQNNWMAVNKSKPGVHGYMTCLIHCWVYAACVATTVICAGWRFTESGAYDSWFVAHGIAFICHYPIDKWSLGAKWMKFYKQTLPDDLGQVNVTTVAHQHRDDEIGCVMPKEEPCSGTIWLYSGLRQYFWAPVYICVDNIMHLTLMWILFSLLG